MIRHSLLRALYALPYFRGRDRLISSIARSFYSRPIRLPDGLQMYLDAGEWGQLEIVVRGATEPKTLRLIGELADNGDVIVDVGAHVGHHAMVAARGVGAAGRVLAIDPQPYNVDRIARNAACNGFLNIEALCAAAGSTDGFVQFHLQDPSDRSRLSLGLPSPNDLGALIEVPRRRLETILIARDIPVIKLLKIDVEGYEWDVLVGLGAKLADCQNIIFEVLKDTPAEMTERITRHLVDAGFLLTNIEGHKWKSGDPLPENNVWAHRKPGLTNQAGNA